MELNERSLDIALSSPKRARPCGSPANARRGGRPLGTRAFSTTAILVGLSFGTTVYGVAAGGETVALVGLAGVGLGVAALALGAREAIRTLERRRELLRRARAESERARHHLEIENAELERRNADLEARQAAISDGFDWIDEQSAGRLRALLEAAGLELAALVDTVLDKREEDA